MDVKELLTDLVQKNINDVFIIAGTKLSYKQGTYIGQIGGDILFPDDTRELVEQIYELASNRSMEKLFEKGDDDFSFAIKGLSRFRVNAYKQRNKNRI
jgi:twitching motility protein PilT